MTKEKLELAGEWYTENGLTLFVYVSGEYALVFNDIYIEITEDEVLHRAKLQGIRKGIK